MQLLVDIGFVVSVLLLFLGLERFLFRSQHRSHIQSFFETLTIETDDFSPNAVIDRLGSPETIRLFALASYFFFCFIIIVTLTVSGIITKFMGVPSPARDMILARAVVCGVSLMLASRWPVPQLLRLAFSSKPSRTRLRSSALLGFFGGSVILLTAMLLAQWLMFGRLSIATDPAADPWTASALLELAFWPAYSIMWLIVAPLVLAIAVFDCPALARRLVRFFAAWLWRVVEYEKGAVSALVLLAAFVLGLLKLLYAG